MIPKIEVTSYTEITDDTNLCGRINSLPELSQDALVKKALRSIKQNDCLVTQLFVNLPRIVPSKHLEIPIQSTGRHVSIALQPYLGKCVNAAKIKRKPI